MMFDFLLKSRITLDEMLYLEILGAGSKAAIVLRMSGLKKRIFSLFKERTVVPVDAEFYVHPFSDRPVPTPKDQLLRKCAEALVRPAKHLDAFAQCIFIIKGDQDVRVGIGNLTKPVRALSSNQDLGSPRLALFQ